MPVVHLVPGKESFVPTTFAEFIRVNELKEISKDDVVSRLGFTFASDVILAGVKFFIGRDGTWCALKFSEDIIK